LADPNVTLSPPALDLEEPGTFLYTGAASSRGLVLNRFALSLRTPDGRRDFLADEELYLGRFDLSADIRRMVRERDWTGLLRAGGHVQALLKFAATVGLNLFDIGAHSAGVSTSTMQASCPRHVSGLGNLDG
jgi:protocatechuate 4,5-dioxygenase alpha chain